MPARSVSEAGTVAGGVTRKQAVVVIHGIGEQIPLQTLRSFVETVYQRDTSLNAGMGRERTLETARADVPLNQTWIVPDDATGTAELRRISTPRDQNGLRTDFFEFYWADIMDGTPIEEVLGWIRGLLLRSPFALPKDIRVWLAWLALWVVSVLFVAFTIATLDPTGALFGWLTRPLRDLMTAGHVWLGLALVALGAVVGASRFAAGTPLPRVRLVPPVTMMLVGIALAAFPVEWIVNEKLWSGLIAAGMAALLNGVIGPYVGDIVRYVRAGPKTVEKRRMVRERGLKLLEALHRRDGSGRPDYERIIMVGHSLGTIVGYDLLQLYWEKAGPTHHKDPVPAAKAAFEAVDEYVKSIWVAPSTGAAFDVREFQRRQAAVFDAIAASPLDFRISDFITLGSPLTHAEFLLADDLQELRENFDLRFLSSSPPRPNAPDDSMTYTDWAVWRGLARGPFLHFAAPFAAVRWTNIYDYSTIPLFGDVVSGSLVDAFGPGIREFDVKIERPRGWLRRLITHTHYWGWDGSYKTKTPNHILVLRGAMNLKGSVRSALPTQEPDAP